MHPWLRITYLGGPTALLEINGLRLLTDPTFDPAGTEYQSPVYTLQKTAGPAIPPEQLAPVDTVLLSHDHHSDNLDNAGRAFLSHVQRVLTTPAGAARLGSASIGVTPWETIELATEGHGAVCVTGTPGRHGPASGDRGPVTGFVLSFHNRLHHAVYVSGDTVWYEGVAEVARRYPINAALLFMGAARVPEVGPHHLTFTAAEAVEAARALAKATIIPVHFEGWRHYTESRTDIANAFSKAQQAHRLRLLAAGETLEFLD